MAEFGEPLYGPDMRHWPYANPEAPKGGSVVLGAFGSFDSLNTYILRGQWPAGIGFIGDSLMTGSGDELSSAYGLIAESAEYPEEKAGSSSISGPRLAGMTANPSPRMTSSSPSTRSSSMAGPSSRASTRMSAASRCWTRTS